VYPHQAEATFPVPDSWRQEFEPVFAWAATHDPDYFTRLTWPDIHQHQAVSGLLRSWVEQHLALGTADIHRLSEALTTIALVEQRHAGQLGQDEFVAALVDAVRPPWGDRPVTLALAEVDPALVDEFRYLDDPYRLATRLTEVLEQDYGFGWEFWFRAAERLAVEVVGEYLLYFAVDCTEHLRWYLPVETPDAPH
jgi:hypothetical protein